MDKSETTVVNTKEIVNENVKITLSEICEDLEERGYDAINQIIAYLISGDPGYISSYKECRSKILKFKREEILEVLLVNFMEK